MTRKAGSTIPHTGLTRSSPVALKAGTLVATTVVVTPATATISVGKTQQLAAVVRDQRGHQMADEAIDTWASDDAMVATVNSAGLVTAVGAGTCTITASSGAIDGDCDVTIEVGVVTTIEITPDGFTIDDDGTQQLTAVVKDQNGNAMGAEVVNWSSDAAGVATVDSEGLVTAVGGGNVEITGESDTDSEVSASVVGAVRATATYDDLADDFPDSSLDTAKWTDASTGDGAVTVGSGKATLAITADDTAVIASKSYAWPSSEEFTAWQLGTLALNANDTIVAEFVGAPPVGGPAARAEVAITYNGESYDVATALGVTGEESEQSFEGEDIAAWTYVALVRYIALRTRRWRLYSSEDGRHWTLRDTVVDDDSWDAFRLTGSKLTISLEFGDGADPATAELLAVGISPGVAP